MAKMNIGTTQSDAAALRGPHNIPLSVQNPATTLVTVIASDLVRMKANKNSFQVKRQVK